MIENDPPPRVFTGTGTLSFALVELAEKLLSHATCGVVSGGSPNRLEQSLLHRCVVATAVLPLRILEVELSDAVRFTELLKDGCTLNHKYTHCVLLGSYFQCMVRGLTATKMSVLHCWSFTRRPSWRLEGGFFLDNRGT